MMMHHVCWTIADRGFFLSKMCVLFALYNLISKYERGCADTRVMNHIFKSTKTNIYFSMPA